MESMVQKVWGQLKSQNLSNSAYIATSKTQVDLLQSQLGYEAKFIIEPYRRDTFPAIALSSLYLYSEKGVSPDEVITVLPVDPCVDDSFFETIKKMEQVVSLTDAEIALIGVKPKIASENYGYIVPKLDEYRSGDVSYYRVERFVEKPTEYIALDLIRTGSFWNCGVFSFKLKYLLNILQEMNVTLDYKALTKDYKYLPQISFDYQVVEKAKKVVVVPYEGDWKDLGTWDILTEEMDTNLLGKGYISPESSNVHLINELDLPVAIIGISDVVLAASPDGILVSDKASSAKIKDIVKENTQKPMFEEKAWGSYRVLDYSLYENSHEVLTRKVILKAGKNLSYQRHSKRTEIWTVLSGYGEYVLDGEIKTITQGDILKIESDRKHSVRAISDLEFIETQIGENIFEDDVERFTFNWEEIKNMKHD